MRYTVDYEGFLAALLPFAEDEGFVLLASRERAYLYLDPRKVLRCDSFATLDKELTFDDAWAGYIPYEMGIEASYFQQSFVEAVWEKGHVEVVLYSGVNSKYQKLLSAAFWESPPVIEKVGKGTDLFCIEREVFEKQVEAAQEAILDGEVYQLNLSHEVRFSYEGKGYPLFLALHQLNPTSYAAFLQVEGQTILSLSPEMLVRKEKTKLVTMPIKGTSRDLNLLRTSEKEKAELLMITDLLRHDLGLVALPATVKVEKLLEESAYYSLFHTSSTISCTVDPKYSPVQLLEQLFPGGSITGCPKIAAKQWIARLEGCKRGIYTGSIGHFLSSGDFIFNIAIRTLLLKEGEGRLALGAGIVSDSTPSAEFNETLLKGAPFFKLLGLNDLI